MIVFDDQILKTGLSFSLGNLGLSITSNGGVLGNFADAPFEGVWIGQLSDTDSIYTMTFTQPVSCLIFSFDGSNSYTSPVETFSSFTTSLNGGGVADCFLYFK